MRTKAILLTIGMLLLVAISHAATYVVNVKSDLNVRTQPAKSGSVAGKLANGDEVEVVSIDGDWAEIEFNGAHCYVSSRYLTAKEEAASADSADSKKAENHDTATKWIYGLLIACALVLWSGGVIRSDGDSDQESKDFSYKLSAGAYVVFCALLIYSVTTGLLPNVVDNRWTGGWLNGWVWAALNSCILAFCASQVFNTNTVLVCRLARYGVEYDPEAYKRVNCHFWFWFIPIAAVFAFVGLFFPLLWFVPIVWLIWVMVKNFRIMWPHWVAALGMMCCGILSCIVVGMLIYVFFQTLILSLLAVIAFVAFLKATPQIAAEALKADSTPTPELEPSPDPDAEYTNVLEDDWSRIKTKNYNLSGTEQIDKYGDIYKKGDDGKFRKKI